MPSKTVAQHNLMAAACEGKSDKVPQSVGCEYMTADRGRVGDLPKRKRVKPSMRAPRQKGRRYPELRGRIDK